MFLHFSLGERLLSEKFILAESELKVIEGFPPLTRSTI